MDKYFDEWPENTPIPWWNLGRKKLNEVIHIVNQWTLNGCPIEQDDKILRHIEMGIQTFGSRDGGSGWRDELNEIKRYVLMRQGSR